MLAALALAVVVALPTSASADKAPVTGGSWYFAGQAPALPPTAGQNLGRPVGVPTPDVPAGDFPAAASGGQSQKETYLHIDTNSIATGSTVQKFVLTLNEDAAANQLTPESAKVQAAPVAGFFVDGSAAASYDERPGTVPEGPVVDGVRGADGTWTFDITPIVAKWVDGSLANNGVALVPKVTTGSPDTFQVVWSGTSPPPTTDGQVIPAAASSGDVPPSDGSQFISDTPVDSGTADTTPVAVEPDFASPVAAPTNPAPATAPATAKPAAASEPESHTGLPVGFFLAALGVLAFVVAGAVALGDLGEPRPGRRGSVLRALERSTPTPLEETP